MVKYGLAFTLLADPERKVIEAYDVWKEKKNYLLILSAMLKENSKGLNWSF